jgi:dienelactone hydrolase
MDKVILDTSWTGIATKPYHIFWTMYGFIPFRMGNTIKATMPRVNSFLSSIRGSADSALPVGCAGFCWGGQHVVRLGLGDSVDPATKLPLSDSLFTAHPSSVTEADFKHIKRPISVASGSKDIVTSLDMIRKAEAALRQSGAKHEVVIYEGARHGWSVRIDRANPKLKEQAEEAERQAVNWFSKTFADVKR